MDKLYMVDMRNNGTWIPPGFLISMVMDKLEKSERGTTLNMLVDCSSTGEEVYGVLQDKGYDVKMVRIKDSEWAIKAKKLI